MLDARATIAGIDSSDMNARAGAGFVPRRRAARDARNRRDPVFSRPAQVASSRYNGRIDVRTGEPGMRWLTGLLIVLLGTALVAARRPDIDTSVVLAAGYGATVVIGVMAGRLIRARAARNRR
ncbi:MULTISPECIES: hypothetical protein [unclassified Burkholderia]|nr:MULTISPECIES: hypothetical protein [unclassified Burkholderia]NIE87308.1 hypothetical protein [Burkholderia sp. Tr-860]NIF68168.1 hypothetical protein [Burkholderia sp. Cy-647]